MRRQHALARCGLGLAVAVAAMTQMILAAQSSGRFPDVPLRTQDNRQVRFYSDLLEGKLVVVNFMFTSCTKFCPRATANLANVQEALGGHFGRDVFFVSITVDPSHDTPAVLAEYARRHQARPGWIFATGAPADIERIRRALGVEDGEDRLQHTAMVIYGNDATGSWGSMPATTTPAAMAMNVLRLLAR